MNALLDLSNALADLADAARPRLAAIHLKRGRHLTATLWQDGLAIVSEQALPPRERFPAVLPGGAETEAELIGRDDGTNLALLRLAAAPALPAPSAATLRTGNLIVAAGSRRDGEPTARLGSVNQVGAAWHSQRGGRIDASIRLDIELAPSEEGGPVLAADGGIAGISTFGPRGRVIVIPHATIVRVLPILAERHHVPHGWLGAVLQAVAIPEAAEGGDGRGFLVTATAKGGPAEAAGLIIGDILVAVEGSPVGSLSALAARLGPESPGTRLELGLLRGGQPLTQTVEIAERPAA